MPLAPHSIRGTTVSDVWLQAVQMTLASPTRKLFHLATHISDPLAEDVAIRTAADQLLAHLEYNSVETVANTIFPLALARQSSDHVQLADRYRAMYPTLKRLDIGNRRGTYFGRLVAYPAGGQSFDQLNDLISKLGAELRTRGPKSSRYEVSFEPVENQRGEVESETAVVYAPGRDRNAMSFPCLSFCSFQLDGDLLHMVAHYRSQYLIQRGYGNYLGLGRLLGYVSDTVGIQTGELLVVAGGARVETPKSTVSRILKLPHP